MTTASDGTVSIPLHAEELSVGRRNVATHHVSIDTETVLHEAQIDEMLRRDDAVIERVAIGRMVPDMPHVRQEGDLVIVPVVEEIAVVEKRLLLKEEIHIRLVGTMHRHQETVTLRRQQAVLGRKPVLPEIDSGTLAGDTKP